ncbi:Uncharacterised protein [Mycobacteroides abscessus subsp. abscessus]|nr:Uncharacterised protein [Mycobacteroides abscessus subsp. abscessus]
MPIAGIARPMTNGIAVLIAQMIGDLDIKGAFEHSLGHQRQQTAGAIDRGAGGLSVCQQRVHGCR